MYPAGENEVKYMLISLYLYTANNAFGINFTV